MTAHTRVDAGKMEKVTKLEIFQDWNEQRVPKWHMRKEEPKHDAKQLKNKGATY